MKNLEMSTDDVRHYYDLAWQQMNRQHESLGRLQTKLGNLLGFEFVLAGLLLSVLRDYTWQEVLPPLSCLLVVWVILVAAYRVRGWIGAPNIDRIKWHKDKGSASSIALLEAVDSISEAYGQNEGIMDFMGRMFNLAVIITMLGALTAFIIVFRGQFVH